jgi:cell division protein FtsA
LSQEEKSGCCSIDIGGGTTDLAIFKDGIIRHTAVIPFGGNVISDDIKKVVLLLKTSRIMKIKFGSAWLVKIEIMKLYPWFKRKRAKEISLKTCQK